MAKKYNDSQSKWECVDEAKHANVYTDRMKVPGGYLYLVSKMIDPNRPSAGADVCSCVFVPGRR